MVGGGRFYVRSWEVPNNHRRIFDLYNAWLHMHSESDEVALGRAVAEWILAGDITLSDAAWLYNWNRNKRAGDNSNGLE